MVKNGVIKYYLLFLTKEEREEKQHSEEDRENGHYRFIENGVLEEVGLDWGSAIGGAERLVRATLKATA